MRGASPGVRDVGWTRIDGARLRRDADHDEERVTEHKTPRPALLRVAAARDKHTRPLSLIVASESVDLATTGILILLREKCPTPVSMSYTAAMGNASLAADLPASNRAPRRHIRARC